MSSYETKAEIKTMKRLDELALQRKKKAVHEDAVRQIKEIKIREAIAGGWVIDCPICGLLTAANHDDVLSGEHDSYVFVHQDIPHDDADIDQIGRAAH